jgi:hypothetical protein
MAEVSGLSYASLASTARNYLRPETLHAANDAISNATAVLPAFRLFDIDDQLHSSSDCLSSNRRKSETCYRHCGTYIQSLFGSSYRRKWCTRRRGERQEKAVAIEGECCFPR